MVADIKELETMDASEIRAWKLDGKEVLSLQNGEKSYSRSQLEQLNYLEEIRF